MSNIRSQLVELCDGFNAHDLDRIMALFAEDCVLEMPRGGDPWGTRWRGKEKVRKGPAGRFAGLPHVHHGDAQHLLDERAATRLTKGTPTRTRPAGRPPAGRGCHCYPLSDG